MAPKAWAVPESAGRVGQLECPQVIGGYLSE